MDKIHTGQSIRSILREMKIGETISFPICRLSVIRSTASTLGLEMTRYYQTKQSKESRTISVTRIA